MACRADLQPIRSVWLNILDGLTLWFEPWLASHFGADLGTSTSALPAVAGSLAMAASTPGFRSIDKTGALP